MSDSGVPNRNDVSDEELVAILVERGVPEHVALERVARLRQDSPTVIGHEGEPIPIDESEIQTWLSLGSFG